MSVVNYEDVPDSEGEELEFADIDITRSAKPVGDVEDSSMSAIETPWKTPQHRQFQDDLSTISSFSGKELQASSISSFTPNAQLNSVNDSIFSSTSLGAAVTPTLSSNGKTRPRPRPRFKGKGADLPKGVTEKSNSPKDQCSDASVLPNALSGTPLVPDAPPIATLSESSTDTYAEDLASSVKRRVRKPTQKDTAGPSTSSLEPSSKQKRKRKSAYIEDDVIEISSESDFDELALVPSSPKLPSRKRVKASHPSPPSWSPPAVSEDPPLPLPALTPSGTPSTTPAIFASSPLPKPKRRKSAKAVERLDWEGAFDDSLEASASGIATTNAEGPVDRPQGLESESAAVLDVVKDAGPKGKKAKKEKKVKGAKAKGKKKAAAVTDNNEPYVGNEGVEGDSIVEKKRKKKNAAVTSSDVAQEHALSGQAASTANIANEADHGWELGDKGFEDQAKPKNGKKGASKSNTKNKRGNSKKSKIILSDEEPEGDMVGLKEDGDRNDAEAEGPSNFQADDTTITKGKENHNEALDEENPDDSVEKATKEKSASPVRRPPPPTTISSRAYSIKPNSTPMSELCRRVNSLPGSSFGTSSARTYNPWLKQNKSVLSKIAPLHPNRRPPPPPPPPVPKAKERKTKKQMELEEQWEMELEDNVEGWYCLTEGEREALRKAKRDKEMGYLEGWEE